MLSILLSTPVVAAAGVVVGAVYHAYLHPYIAAAFKAVGIDSGDVKKS